jgi:hypothetical protein
MFVAEGGDMDFVAILDRLERFGPALAAVVAGLSPEEARFKPASGAWSILEIVCHLGDEEVEDFRARVLSTLSDPGVAWSPIDPEAVARERRYNEQDLGAAVTRLVSERRKSVEMLRGFRDPDWSRAYVHPKAGRIAAGDLLASWAAHDALHLRQIAKRMWELAGRDGAPYRTGYAGEWGA